MSTQSAGEPDPGQASGRGPDALVDLGVPENWHIESPDAVTATLSASEKAVLEGRASVCVEFSGSGQVVCRPPTPLPLPDGATAVQVWVYLQEPFEREHIPQLVLLLEGGSECALGPLDFRGWHLLHRQLQPGGARHLAGVALREVFVREETAIHLHAMGFKMQSTRAPALAAPELPPPYAELPSMLPELREEVDNETRKEGISFIFEARSLSAVVRFVYTPIEGNLSDIELEINNAGPIKPAESGGITIEMGGRDWRADDEEIERHFVSCEQVGDWVEARWRWKYGEELADFLYRFGIRGKSLFIEVEGGNGKATGVDLGYVAGAAHPRSIQVPYFTLGSGSPRVLCTAGVFISGLLDWYTSGASRLRAPALGQEPLHLNGGCAYLARSDGKRQPLRERIILTVSRQFDEVMPAVPTAAAADQSALCERVWYNIPTLDSSEEAYVEIYERLRSFKLRALDHILVNHPPQTWIDAPGAAPMTLAAAPVKGGTDALSEYLEAVQELGYSYSLYANYTALTPLDKAWNEDRIARLSDGNLAPAGPGQYRLKSAQALLAAPAHQAALAAQYHGAAPYIAQLASSPPWERLDCDHRLEDAARFVMVLRAEQALLAALSNQGLTLGEGGQHWLYPGLLQGYSARLEGDNPSRRPLLVDFDLRHLHPLHAHAGLGTVEEFFGGEIASGDKHSRSPFLDRYLATTIAYGHAGLLPDPEEWGLPALIKSYCLLQKLQTYYLGIAVRDISYHHDGHLLETTEALVSGAHEHSQVRIEYENGLQVFVNGSWEENWTIERGDSCFTLAPGSFVAVHDPDGLLVYSADLGSGRVDCARCADYFYCDTRGRRLDMGPLALEGAALVRQQGWQIDVYPVDTQGEIEVFPDHFWPERRMPRLRLLAFGEDEGEPDILRADIADRTVTIPLREGVYKYRITLPEWMVEPGQ